MIIIGCISSFDDLSETYRCQPQDRLNGSGVNLCSVVPEPSHQNYDAVAAHGVHSNIAVQFQVQDAEKLSLESNVFDAVVSRHVIWTLPDPYTAAQEWVRVTKPGGRVIVDIPRMGSHSGSHHIREEIGKSLPFYNGADPEKNEEMHGEKI